MSASTRRVIGAVAMFVCALALQRAATAAWGHATMPNGALRYTLSPVGLTREAYEVRPGTPPSRRASCRWWPTFGDRALCATPPAGRRHFERLRLAYPLLQVALWASVLSLFMQVIRVPRSSKLQALLPAVVCALTVGATFAMAADAPNALTVLAGLPLDLDGPGFTLGLVAATLGLAGAASLLLDRGRPGV